MNGLQLTDALPTGAAAVERLRCSRPRVVDDQPRMTPPDDEIPRVILAHGCVHYDRWVRHLHARYPHHPYVRVCPTRASVGRG